MIREDVIRGQLPRRSQVKYLDQVIFKSTLKAIRTPRGQETEKQLSKLCKICGLGAEYTTSDKPWSRRDDTKGINALVSPS